MGTNQLSFTAKTFLTNEMNICTEDLCTKIFNDFPHKFEFFNSLIDFIISLEPPLKYIDSSHSNNWTNRDFLNAKIMEFVENYDMNTESEEYIVFDSIRHAYIVFKEGGVLQLYKSREAECWYPKVVIRKNLGIAKDIELLGDEVCIYRGTSRDEYETHSFGQSWTLDEQIAEEFAFKHYIGQPNYQGTQRVVMKAKIKKEFIYYYDNRDNEHETIIDERELLLDSLLIIDQRILE